MHRSAAILLRENNKSVIQVDILIVTQFTDVLLLLPFLLISTAMIIYGINRFIHESNKKMRFRYIIGVCLGIVVYIILIANIIFYIL